ncbi:MAG TPA: TonB family protein [Gemmatimonadales bacterium]|nr:TonB family protein [Gemmatimonadales bacterium]
MADAKALFTQRFEAARAAFTKGDEPAAAECLHSAIAAARSDPSLRRELVSALFHLGKLSRTLGRAGEAEAEPLLSEALAIAEGLFGREHAALAPLLNELSRLYIQRSQHARAQDVLERWLAIARSKSEENADVAAALAGLAVVKRKLGDDASAEALYRDALRIREKVLEPSHMVTVVTMEQLSATCAARGNFDEALALLRRALEKREVALGPGHATVQVARSRVAELELQAAVAADTAAAAAAKAARGATPTPAWLKRVPKMPRKSPSTTLPSPVHSKRLELLDEPEPLVLGPSALSHERAKRPAVTGAVAAVSLTPSSIRMPSGSQIVVSPPQSARPSVSASGRESGVQQYDVVLAAVAPSDVARNDVAVGEWRSTPAPVRADWLGLARKQRPVLYASAGVAAVAIAGLLMVRPRVGGGADPVSAKISATSRTTATSAPVVTAALTRSVSKATGAAATMEAMGVDSPLSASATPARTAPAAQPSKRALDSAPPELRLPRVDVHLRRINIPSVPLPSVSAAPSVDSIVRSATERQRASDTDRTAAADKVSAPRPTDVDRAAVAAAITPAKIIGHPPAPRFPDALLRSGPHEGEVVVRFIVNEYGTVDLGSMIVERSDHDQFTAAVRDILPRFRFEPARTHAPESKPVASWVSVPFRFTTTER